MPDRHVQCRGMHVLDRARRLSESIQKALVQARVTSWKDTRSWCAKVHYCCHAHPPWAVVRMGPTSSACYTRPSCA